MSVIVACFGHVSGLGSFHLVFSGGLELGDLLCMKELLEQRRLSIQT